MDEYDGPSESRGDWYQESLERVDLALNEFGAYAGLPNPEIILIGQSLAGIYFSLALQDYLRLMLIADESMFASRGEGQSMFYNRSMWLARAQRIEDHIDQDLLERVRFALERRGENQEGPNERNMRTFQENLGIRALSIALSELSANYLRLTPAVRRTRYIQLVTDFASRAFSRLKVWSVNLRDQGATRVSILSESTNAAQLLRAGLTGPEEADSLRVIRGDIFSMVEAYELYVPYAGMTDELRQKRTLETLANVIKAICLYVARDGMSRPLSTPEFAETYGHAITDIRELLVVAFSHAIDSNSASTFSPSSIYRALGIGHDAQAQAQVIGIFVSEAHQQGLTELAEWGVVEWKRLMARLNSLDMSEEEAEHAVTEPDHYDKAPATLSDPAKVTVASLADQYASVVYASVLVEAVQRNGHGTLHHLASWQPPFGPRIGIGEALPPYDSHLRGVLLSPVNTGFKLLPELPLVPKATSTAGLQVVRFLL